VPKTLINPGWVAAVVVKTEPRTSGRVIGETIFIILAALALLLWLTLLILAGFFRETLDRFLMIPLL
jgi:hypothetical protein